MIYKINTHRLRLKLPQKNYLISTHKPRLPQIPQCARPRTIEYITLEVWRNQGNRTLWTQDTSVPRIPRKQMHLTAFSAVFSRWRTHCTYRTSHVDLLGKSWQMLLSLFLIYVNDLPDWIKNDMRMFADDTKIWTRIGGLTDCVRLQADLNQLHAWSDKWLLSFYRATLC